MARKRLVKSVNIMYIGEDMFSPLNKFDNHEIEKIEEVGTNVIVRVKYVNNRKENHSDSRILIFRNLELSVVENLKHLWPTTYSDRPAILPFAVVEASGLGWQVAVLLAKNI